MKPLISIIIPVYNVERYLPKCLDSVISQTYQNLEILLIDDGSSDSSGQICDEYSTRDRRITVFHKENGGVSSSRNLGLSKYTGDFLMFMDADDYMSEDAVELLYNRINQDGSDLVIGRSVYVDDNGEKLKETYGNMIDSVMDAQDALRCLGTEKDLPCYVWAKLYRRTVMENIQYPPISCSEDAQVFPLVIYNCRQISTVSQIFYYYVQHSNSAMHTMNDKKFMERMEAFLCIARFMKDLKLEYNAKCYYTCAVLQIVEMMDVTPARKLLRASFTLRERIRLQKKDIHSLLRLAALYIPIVKKILLQRQKHK